MKTELFSIGLFCAILSCCKPAFAQTDMDALRFSQSQPNGTARFNAMGGAFTALGGDLSAAAQNPAGLAIMRSSEISGSLNLHFMGSTSSYNGTSRTNLKANLNIPTIGALIYNPLESDYGWKSNFFGITYNRTQFFTGRLSMEGSNPDNSFTTYLADRARGTQPGQLDPFVSAPFFSVYLLDTIPGTTNQYFSPFQKGGVNQVNEINRSGNIGETNFLFGGNFRDKLFLGTSIAIHSARFNETIKYSEVDEADSIDYLKSFQYDQKLSSEGRGFSGKLGMIYKPSDWIRLGLSVQTPVLYRLTDDFSTFVSAVWDSSGTIEKGVDGQPYSYTLITPARAHAGLAVIIKKAGLISVDYEVVDYGNTRYFSNDYSYTDLNARIANKYRQASNLRIGGEIRLDPFALRLGYALYGNPYKSGINTNAERSYYSGGIGYRQDNIFMDLSFTMMNSKELYYFYDKSYVNPVENKFVLSSTTFTIGVKF